MKLIHLTTKTLSTKEFNDLSDDIIDALYELNPDMKGLYDIHINYINDSWKVDFIPTNDNIPVIKVDAYTENDDNGTEYLRLLPQTISDIPDRLKFKDENGGINICNDYLSLFDFVLSLYDFEYKLS